MKFEDGEDGVKFILLVVIVLDGKKICSSCNCNYDYSYSNIKI